MTATHYVARGHSYENFYTRKFIIRKFVDTKIPDLRYSKGVLWNTRVVVKVTCTCTSLRHSTYITA